MSQRQTHQPVMISAEPERRGKVATLLTVVALLTASVAVIFLGACDPVFLLPIGDKLASVGLGGTWATIMAWRPVACGVAASVLMAAAAALWQGNRIF